MGTVLLLLVVGAYGGLSHRAERSSWTYLSGGARPVLSQGQQSMALGDDEVLVASTDVSGTAADLFEGTPITRVDIASTQHSTVMVPGVRQLPRLGHYLASPALARLVGSTAADLLGDRYGILDGIIADEALAGPDALVAVVGAENDDLVRRPGALLVSEFQGFSSPSQSYAAVAIIGGIAVFFPVIVFIGVVTRLGSTARAERFAALRLVGATPHRVATIAALETGVAALSGTLVGVILTGLLVPVVALTPVENVRFFVSDLRVDLGVTLLVGLGTVVIATVASYRAAANSSLGPLGGSRERFERAPRWYSVVPLGAGVAIMGITAGLATSGHALPATDVILVGGFIMTAIGLLLAGPVLTAWVSRLAADRVRSAAAVLAMNRIRQHPRATFRAVSGLMLAVFIVSVFSAAITTARIDSVVDASAQQRISPGVLTAHLSYPLAPPLDKQLAAQLAPIAATTGVDAVVLAFNNPDGGLTLAARDAARLGLAVPAGASLVRVEDGYFQNTQPSGPALVEAQPDGRAEQAAPVSVFVVTDGSPGARERARTALEISSLPLWAAPTTRAEDAEGGLQEWASRYAGLADVGILVASLVSVTSLAISTVGGVLDRRRVIALLRLMGMPGSTLRRMIAIQAAIPIATVFVLCIGLGFLVAWTLLAGLTGGRRTVSWPAPDYYVTIAVSLAIAALAVVSTFRTARQSTTSTATRFE